MFYIRIFSCKIKKEFVLRMSRAELFRITALKWISYIFSIFNCMPVSATGALKSF